MSRLTQIELVIRKYASIPVAIFCLAALALFVVIGYRSVLGPILGGTIGAVAAVLILHVRKPTLTDTSWTVPDYRIAGIVTSLYVFAVFTIYRFVQYEQPLTHYLVFGGFAGYVGYEIAAGARRARVVPQLLALTFVTYWSVQLAFPAGMNEPDTRGQYIPVIHSALDTGVIEGYEIYLGHLAYVTEGVVITGLSPKTGYFLMATLVLTGTVLTLSTLDLAFPSFPLRIELYGALFFGCMSWTLGRGFHPTKLSFFYALTLLLGMVTAIQYVKRSRELKRRWLIMGAFVGSALIFGHQYSAGAALIFVIVVTGFAILAPYIPTGRYSYFYPLSAIVFTTAYGISILGNPLHSGPLLSRFVGLVTSIFLPADSGGGAGGGPGRYSELSMEILLFATSGEAILFFFGVLGAAIGIRYVDWKYDLLIFWMSVVAVFLAISLVFNAADTQPQRFYSLLGLFGLNLFAGLALVYLVRSDVSWFTPRSVALVIFAFAIMSLASPIAGMHISMVSDDVPHNRLHDTEQILTGSEWVDTYEGNSETMFRTRPQGSDIPYEIDSGLTAVADTSEIPPGYRYAYTKSAADTGVRTSGGFGLGDRTYVFLELDPNPRDSVIYSNGDTTVYHKPSNDSG